jgi:hypothetical protein
MVQGRWLLLDGENLEAAAGVGSNLTSAWVPFEAPSRGEIEYECVTGTGTPTATINVEWSNLDKYDLDALGSSVTDNEYEVTEIAADGALTLDKRVTITNAIFVRPMKAMRLVVDITEATAQKSTFSAWLNTSEQT